MVAGNLESDVVEELELDPVAFRSYEAVAFGVFGHAAEVGLAFIVEAEPPSYIAQAGVAGFGVGQPAVG